jgi:hypothetical protein
MTVDISIAAAKSKSSVRVLDEGDTSTGDAVYLATRREPAFLRDHQADAIKGFSMKYLRANQRDPFRYAVLSRLSGCPGDGACYVAMIAAAIEIGVDEKTLTAAGLTQKLRGSTRNPNGTRETNRAPIP